MMILIASIIMVSGLTVLFLVKGQSEDPAQLQMPRPQIPTIGVQIICGNCAGDNIIAHKTYLDHNGNCHQCGGHSYVLASFLAMQTLQLRAQRAAEPSLPTGGRVIPFDPAAWAARSEKIAV